MGLIRLPPNSEQRVGELELLRPLSLAANSIGIIIHVEYYSSACGAERNATEKRSVRMPWNLTQYGMFVVVSLPRSLGSNTGRLTTRLLNLPCHPARRGCMSLVILVWRETGFDVENQIIRPRPLCAKLIYRHAHYTQNQFIGPCPLPAKIHRGYSNPGNVKHHGWVIATL
jgi:hypothetical protein